MGLLSSLIAGILTWFLMQILGVNAVVSIVIAIGIAMFWFLVDFQSWRNRTRNDGNINKGSRSSLTPADLDYLAALENNNGIEMDNHNSLMVTAWKFLRNLPKVQT